jgi:leucyl-tRNA synthetase
LGIKAEEMTDDVWEYVLTSTAPLPSDTKISLESMNKLRGEFTYFYPLDLRCSGKDLVTNHLTFSIYNHVALFPKDNWPRAIRANGHLLLNNEKMSKSTGNFLSLRQAIDKYGADAVRFSLADAGDSMDDANFLEKTADGAILRLFTEKEWMTETMASVATLRTGPYTWLDRVFMHEIAKNVQECYDNYEGMLFKMAVKSGFYELQNARNEYRKAVLTMETSMHRNLVIMYIEVQALVMAPVIPHWSDDAWTVVLGKKETVLKALWPVIGDIIGDDKGGESVLAAAFYIRTLVSKIRSHEDKIAMKRAKGKKIVGSSGTGDRKMILYVASGLEWWF